MFWVLNSYPIYGLQKVLPFCRLPFHFVNCFFCCADAFEFDVPLLIFVFVVWAFDVMYRKLFPIPILMDFFPTFSSASFMVSGLLYKSDPFRVHLCECYEVGV